MKWLNWLRSEISCARGNHVWDNSKTKLLEEFLGWTMMASVCIHCGCIMQHWIIGNPGEEGEEK